MTVAIHNGNHQQCFYDDCKRTTPLTAKYKNSVLGSVSDETSTVSRSFILIFFIIIIIFNMAAVGSCVEAVWGGWGELEIRRRLERVVFFSVPENLPN